MKIVVCDIGENKVVFLKEEKGVLTTRFVVKGTRYKTLIPPAIQTIRSKVFNKGKGNLTKENILKTELDYADKIINVLDEMIDEDTHFLVTSLSMHSKSMTDEFVLKLMGSVDLIWDYAKQLNPAIVKGINTVELQRFVNLSAYNRLTLWNKFLKFDNPEIVWCKEIIKDKPRTNDGTSNLVNSYFTIQYYKNLIK